jgi:hypothetical protein
MRFLPALLFFFSLQVVSAQDSLKVDENPNQKTGRDLPGKKGIRTGALMMLSGAVITMAGIPFVEGGYDGSGIKLGTGGGIMLAGSTILMTGFIVMLGGKVKLDKYNESQENIGELENP